MLINSKKLNYSKQTGKICIYAITCLLLNACSINPVIPPEVIDSVQQQINQQLQQEQTQSSVLNQTPNTNLVDDYASNGVNYDLIPKWANQLQDLPNWQSYWQQSGNHLSRGWQAWLNSCQSLINQANWAMVCQQSQQIDPQAYAAQKQLFETYLKPRLLQSTDGINKITGYYEPLFDGNLSMQGEYQYPVYALPAHLKNTNLTRQQLMSGALQGQEIAYLKSPIDVTYLHIQGSALIKLPDGQYVRLAYAGNNNQPFKSFTNYLLQQKVLQPAQANIEGLRAFAKQYPDKVEEALNSNPRFIFFKREAYNHEGPKGAMGRSLVAQHSIAVDTNYIPLGTPVWLSFNHPIKSINHLVMAQDVGSAIKGSVRADFFWGLGDIAGQVAQKTNTQGLMYVLEPK